MRSAGHADCEPAVMRFVWLVLGTMACADEPGRIREAITGGTAESGYPSVFALAYEGQGGCTGTCIAPRIGLTAKHCVEGDPATSFTALFGDTEQSPERVIAVTALEMHESADIAVLAFEEDCPAVIPANRAALEEHVGGPVVMVGFGVTVESAGDAGIKRSGTATLFSVDPREVNGLEQGELATSNDPDGTCNGDSGGPTFMTLGGAEVVIGVTSRGSLDERGREWPCGMGRSIAVRADSYLELIDDFIDAHAPASAPDAGPEPSSPDAGPEPSAPDAGTAPTAPPAGESSGCRTIPATPAALVLVAMLFVRRSRRR
jgi:secreted trypsin-like serine protease